MKQDKKISNEMLVISDYTKIGQFCLEDNNL